MTATAPTAPDPHFENLLQYLRRARGFDFTGYKRPSLMRRMLRRMQNVGVEAFADYQDYLEVHPDEFAQLFNTILINVTSFFRDAAAWQVLAEQMIPRLLETKSADEPLRVWSAGCASGEEAYSVAILLAEAVGLDGFRERVKIFATDVDEEALGAARQTSYTAKDLEAVPAALRNRYFERSGGRMMFRADLRRCVVFGQHDLVQDAPISRLDLLICRNTLMYFNAETQGRIVTRFHYALNDLGYLFLGKAELLLTYADLFAPVDISQRIFSKVPRPRLRERVALLAPNDQAEAAGPVARLVHLREVAFDTGLVAQVVVDTHGQVALFNERARQRLGLSGRDLGQRLKDLELSYRPVELRSLIDRAYAEGKPVTLADTVWPRDDGAMHYLDTQVVPLQDRDGSLLGASILFIDATPMHVLKEELQHAQEALETAYEELQSSGEELEATNEELQSTVEELETSNEELQSTNEELETMNEELQSTNEELQAINGELVQRTDELNQSNAFMASVLASMRVGVIVVDRELQIRTWSHKSEELWGLRADEVVGRNLLTLDIGLPVDKLKAPMRRCLAGNDEDAELTLESVNRRGRTIRCRVTCTPLHGAQKDIRGVILSVEVREREK